MKLSFLILVVVLICSACEEEKNNVVSKTNKEKAPKKETIEIESYKKLEGFSSGSGMTFYKNHFYLVGDDDPYLIKINKKGDILQKWQLWDTIDVENGRINKSVKPDFEAISLYPFKNDTLLLIFGSGSKSPKRDVIFTFNLQTEKIDTLQGNIFFSWLKKSAGLSNEEINLEGAAFHEGILYLFNRHNNYIYSIPQMDFSTYLETGETTNLNLSQNRYILPVYKNDTARFSGASVLAGKNTLLFSATIETTNNWEDDGKILGSFMGKIELDNLQDKTPVCLPVLNIYSTRFEGKIEAPHAFISGNNHLEIYFITDDDDGSTGWGNVKW